MVFDLTNVSGVYPNILQALLEARRRCFLVLCKLVPLQNPAILGRRVETYVTIRNRNKIIYIESLPSGLCCGFVISFGTATPGVVWIVISRVSSKLMNSREKLPLTNSKDANSALQPAWKRLPAIDSFHEHGWILKIEQTTKLLLIAQCRPDLWPMTVWHNTGSLGKKIANVDAARCETSGSWA